MDNNRRSLDLSLLSPGMMALLVAQFLSALADNAILIVAIAIVKIQGLPQLIPQLQESFVLPFILLAPFVGQIADRYPKGHVMFISNLLKLVGAVAMALDISSLISYGFIGIGAAIYSPAKYGILSQMFRPDRLVRANGMMEGSTIVAILLGVVLGGWLTDYSMSWAFAGVLSAYGLAAFSNLFIPRLPVESCGASLKPWRLLLQFFAALSLLFKNPDSRFSLMGTSLFWGCGSTLRLMLFAWVPVALLITDNQTPANLMGVVSIGIVAGAVIAGAWISLDRVNRALLGGLILGPLIFILAHVNSLAGAVTCMLFIGICGGILVVPLNALLQEQGHTTIGAGKALAVQNFAENISMLLLAGTYGLAAAATIPVGTIVIGFGIMLLLAFGMLAMSRPKFVTI